MQLRYILISDGSSDEALIPVIEDALLKFSKYSSFTGHRADLSRYPKPLKKLSDKIDCAVDLFRPDIVFIHRDAEKESLVKRTKEINNALAKCKMSNVCRQNHVKVIPVRMTEAWLLIDENAIKSASNNPNSNEKLDLPPIKRLEEIPNPKQLLENLIILSSGLSRRRLKKLNIGHSIQLVSRYIEDFSVLEKLPSYQLLIKEITDKLN